MLFGISTPIFSIVSLNIILSSPFSIASRFMPITSTPYFSRTPAFESAIVRLSPVCPPKFGKRESGRSFAIISDNLSTLSGSMYVMSAVSGSVIIVAGLEFTSTT